MIVQSWVFPTPQTITPDDDDLPESLRSPLFAHERKPDEPWRKHRKQKSVHFPTAPYSPAKSESSPRRATVSLSSPPMSPTSIPLQPILEEVDGAALSDMEEDALMFKEEMDDPLTFKEDVNAGKRKDSSVL